MAKPSRISTVKALQTLAATINSTPNGKAAVDDRRTSSITYPSQGELHKSLSEADKEIDLEYFDTTKTPQKLPANHDTHGKDPMGSFTKKTPATDQRLNVQPLTPDTPSIRNDNRPSEYRPSETHGHGHHTTHPKTPRQLHVQEPITPASLSKKRRLSTGIIDAGPRKTVRFSPNDKQQPVNSIEDPQPRKSTQLDATIQFPQQKSKRLLKSLKNHPRALPLTEVSGCLQTLQKLTEEFSKNWFGESGTFQPDFPLHELKEKYPALFFITQYVLDASTTTTEHNSGWRLFFEVPGYRQYLVYAILGEWFTQRILKHTAFGLSPAMQERLSEEVDRKYLHHDAIIRAKKRSKMIEKYWYENQKAAQKWLSRASNDFAEELLVVLEPLLRSCISRDRYIDQFVSELAQLVSSCAGLHLSMLCSGENGTVFMYAGARGNGNVFHKDNNRFTCVNPAVFEEPRDSEKSPSLRIKMTCWARIEAYVPHGKDLLEMAAVERRLIRKAQSAKETHLGRKLTKVESAKIQKHFDWTTSKSGREFWAPLPEELWTDAQARDEKQDMMARSYAIRKQYAIKTGTKAADHDDDLSDSSDSETDSQTSDYGERTQITTSFKKDVPCGPYTTIYHCICPHVVYCEWVDTAPIDGSQITPDHKLIREVNTLAAAVAQARSELRGSTFRRAKFQDLARNLWDFYARNNLKIEWCSFLAASLISLTVFYRGTDMISIKTVNNAASAAASLGPMFKEILSQCRDGFNEGRENISQLIRYIRNSMVIDARGKAVDEDVRYVAGLFPMAEDLGAFLQEARRNLLEGRREGAENDISEVFEITTTRF